MTPMRPRWGLAATDVVLAVAGLGVIASLVYPMIEHRAFEDRVERAAYDVDALRAAADRYRARTGHWPPHAGADQVPAELVPLLPADAEVRTDDYALGWSLWKVVKIPAQPAIPTAEAGAPPPDARPTTPPPDADSVGTRPPVVVAMAGITVNSTEDGLLGALLERYGETMSFVRDSSWTLVMGADSLQ